MRSPLVTSTIVADRPTRPALQFPVTRGVEHEFRLITNTRWPGPPLDGSCTVILTWPR